MPPQQRDWWAEVVQQDLDGHNRTNPFGKLSQEICNDVFMGVDDFPIGMDEAKEIRLHLMEERKRYVIDSNYAFESNEFALCEH